MKRLVSLGMAALLTGQTMTPVLAGSLGDFEHSVTKKPTPEQPESTGTSGSNNSYDLHGDAEAESQLFSILMAVTLGGLAYGGIASFERVNDNVSRRRQREPGEPTLPFIRVDFNYQLVSEEVNATDLEVEAGYGPLAFQFRYTHFMEHDPEDTLDAIEYLGLWRMSGYKSFEADLGLGALSIERDETSTGFMVALPLQYHPSEWVGVRFRPGWAWINDNAISDYDIRAMLSYKYISLQAGYRWLMSPGMELKGPYLGVSLRY